MIVLISEDLDAWEMSNATNYVLCFSKICFQ
jgi:hypothetical protein